MGSHFGTTVWRGSAFDCASSEISLLHNNYNSTMRAYGECNNGSIVAQGLRTENGVTYISQLNISVSTNIIGRTIECLYDLTTFLLVGSAIISDLSGIKLTHDKH